MPDIQKISGPAASGDIADACDPTPSANYDPILPAGYDSPEDLPLDFPDSELKLDNNMPLDPECVAGCVIGYDNGSGEDFRQNIRMFHHADTNGDCVIDAFDYGEIKDFYEKGFGPKFNPGFEKVDYDRDGIIYLDEVSMNKHDANDRCAGNEADACTRCDDDDDTSLIGSCL